MEHTGDPKHGLPRSCGGLWRQGGRYVITADNTHVTEKASAVPLKVIGESGITVFGPAMKCSAKESKVMRLETSAAERFPIDFDELDSLADQVFKNKKKKQ